MRILFDNLIYNAILSADYVDADFPVTNIQNDYVDKIYKSTTTSAIIAIQLDSVHSINCMYIANTNAVTAILSLYNSSNALISTIPININRNGQSFATVLSVHHAILTIASSEIVYLGNIGLGFNYITPKVQNDVLPKPIDNSNRDSSDFGNFNINPVPIRQKYDVTFPDLTRTQYNELFNLWAGSIGHPLWSDVYENSTGEMNPMFGVMTMDNNPTHERKRDIATFSFEEAR